MAAGRLPKPGTDFGPCVDPACGHIDCAQTRLMAENLCRYCGKQVGYETRFYTIDVSNGEEKVKTTVHALCHEEALESEQAKSQLSL